MLDLKRVGHKWRRKGKLDYWAICGDSNNGAVPNVREIGLLIVINNTNQSGALCKIKSSKSFGQRLSGGVYKGIPNGLKQSRPVTGPLLPNQDKWTEMAKVTNPGKRRNAADARVCYGQVKKLRWDDDDSIVKHKLATMAETVDKRRENSRGSCSPSKRPLLGGECPCNYIRKIQM
eukprot:Em0014g969a